MKRRTFLKNTSLFSLPTFLGGFNVAAMPSRLMDSMINGDSDRILILIDLNGGNDGLNMFIPMDGYDNLANARPNVILPKSQLLDLTDTLKIHPEMTGVRNLYDHGNLTVIQGVGYPNQNRSHFRSADIWNTAVNSDEYKNTGWLGRYLDDEFPGYPQDYPTDDCPDPFAITMGGSISGTCQGMSTNFSLALLNPNDLGGLTTGVEAPLPNDCYGEELGFLVETFKKSNAYAERVIAAADEGSNNSTLYPDTRLAKKLEAVAKLISGGLQTRIYVVSLGGFDTHAEQVDPNNHIIGKHAELLRTLSDAIYAFTEDLRLQNLHERVMGMTFSEFGRKIISNGGNGTDHGSAAPMMIFGSCVNQGIVGDNAQIATQVDDNEGVAMQYDFKSVYGSVLMDWFEVPEEKVKEFLVPDFQYIPIVGDCTVVKTEEILPILETEVFPNPFGQTFTLRFSIMEKETVRIELFDVVGKAVQVVSNKELTAGAHEVNVEGHSLAAGVYFVRIQAGNGVKTIRVVKN